jgi:tungstate transport system permease protein
MEGFSFLYDAVVEAWHLMLGWDRQVLSATTISLRVSMLATLLCTIVGLPIGLLLATRRFRGRQLTITLLNTMMAIPTVVIGLFVYSLLTRRSLFGSMDLLFTQTAMVIGQTMLGLPLLISLTASAFNSLDRSVRDTAITLGADRVRIWTTMIWEGRFALVAAVSATFGRLIGEVGIAMLVGGNIAGQTRNITTALALETSKGEFSRAMALGIILLLLALCVNFLLRYFQGRGETS